jgi:hypothetical protein
MMIEAFKEKIINLDGVRKNISKQDLQAQLKLKQEEFVFLMFSDFQDSGFCYNHKAKMALVEKEIKRLKFKIKQQANNY